MAAMDHHVVIVGRSTEKCMATSEEIFGQCGKRIDWLVADLSSQAAVRRLAQSFKQRFGRLDVLINNAGAVYIRRQQTEDGQEMGWAVNYFQAFLLTHLLLDWLQASAPARVINLSSNFHWAARLNLENLQERGVYIGWNVYARTKLASLYFTRELARHLAGSGVTANAIHPGLVATGMGKTSGRLLRAVFSVVDRFAIPPAQGAEGLVHLALDPELQTVSGEYFDGLTIARSSPISYDQKIARRLWEKSRDITGIS
jgi:NAD(P)-dependent dehydrogenase (short-subunit alcohol dehydrogenase family)